MNHSMTLAEAIANFTAKFAEYGDMYALTADNVGGTSFICSKVRQIDGEIFTQKKEVDLLKCDNHQHINRECSTNGTILIHKLYRGKIMISAQFRPVRAT